MSLRVPTTPEVAYRWHTKAIEANGDRAKMPPIHENDPKPGWYMRRLIQKGPYVPARIWLEAEVGDDGELLSQEQLLCEVDGKRREVGSEWTWLAGKPITEDKYMEMLAGNFGVSEPEDPYTGQTINGDAFNAEGAPEETTPPPTPKGAALF